VPGKRPPARDGHTGLVMGNSLFVFGGDRHHMPFNDFFVLDILSEFEDKGVIEAHDCDDISSEEQNG
jgi:hypothetical protein